MDQLQNIACVRVPSRFAAFVLVCPRLASLDASRR